ncbi:MAG: SURF1 family protein [Actinomycetota bacterium]
MTGSRSRRVIVVGVAVVVATTCIGLGLWQLRRLDERRALNAQIVARRSDPPIVIEHAGARPAPYRRAVVHGSYDVEQEVLVFGRSLDGEAGHLVVTPLVLGDESAILVVRGWVPFAMQMPPIARAAPPEGDVTVRGSLVPDEGDGTTSPDADRVIRVLDVRGIASTLGDDVFPLPLQLQDQAPPQPGSLPAPAPLPELSEGPHLSYALQWFSFAVVAVAGAAILLRRDRRSPTASP